MSTSNRQSSLLVAEDWKKIYETFREADFKSYDFETLRKSMVDYLKLYYPEDFNDFIESSEFIALIDLIAFMGQSLAYRTDINARENFLDTAERRDSILKLARLVNYSAKRNINASGFLKIKSIVTSESMTDSNGINLANVSLNWNDPTNNNWLEQISIVLNAALIDSQIVGKPGNSQVINGITNDEYAINLTPGTVAAFRTTSSINGVPTKFEVVSATSVGQPYIYEVDPTPVGKFNILYKNDNQGNSSNNTGFFLYFKQGELQTADFVLSESLPNRVFTLDYDNINNTDVWLYKLNAAGIVDTLWKKVPAVAGVNVVYNKLAERNLYQINTRVNDQIDLVFGDGAFANIPQGNFRSFFRTSSGLSYKITPEEMQNITINLTYVSRSGRTETMSISAGLKYTVTNAASRETIEDIRQKAPQQYYTQGRMITGEDYNIIPYTQFSNTLKVKAVNRTSSGISRFLDVIDSSGKYSSTNIFAEDGYLYRDEGVSTLNFSFVSASTVQQVVQSGLIDILNSREMLHFYYGNFTRYPTGNTPTNVDWSLSSLTTNGCTGYFVDALYDPANTIDHTVRIMQLGQSTTLLPRYIKVGAIIKFKAPPNSCFNAQNNIVDHLPKAVGEKLYLYVSTQQVIGDGTNGGAGNFPNGTGTVTLNQKVPSGAVIDEIIPAFKNKLATDQINSIVSRILEYNEFGLRFDLGSETWEFVDSQDINVTDRFSLTTNGTTVGSPGDNTGQAKDASWLIRFSYSANIGYTIVSRSLNYIFESKLETKFYFDNQVKVYDSRTGTTIRDQINILKVNTLPDLSSMLGVDYKWYVHKNVIEPDGFQNQSKVLLTFPDENTDGLPDNPDIFDLVVNPSVNQLDKLVYFKQATNYDGFLKYTPIDFTSVVSLYPTLTEVTTNSPLYYHGQIFFTPVTGRFYVLNVTPTGNVIEESAEYSVLVGREGLLFQYRHNSPGYRRIDPSPNNIIDIFLLTKAYETDYRRWIQDSTNTLLEPLQPSTEQLTLEYNSLEKFKAISDAIIFNSAKYKPLFGTKAIAELQATFKVVKNQASVVSDNDVKSNVITAINKFFAIENWDFGETFFFSELSAYLHATLSPAVSSVIIVPADSNLMFGNLYQINAEANEILVSSATVDNVEIISAITASQINANYAGVNTRLLGLQ